MGRRFSRDEDRAGGGAGVVEVTIALGGPTPDTATVTSRLANQTHRVCWPGDTVTVAGS